MPPLSYPDLSWSGGVSRLVRTLQIVAIAGTVGAVGGGIGVLALMGLPGGSPHPQSRAEGARAQATPPAHSMAAVQPVTVPAPTSQAAIAAQPKTTPPTPAQPAKPTPAPTATATASHSESATSRSDTAMSNPIHLPPAAPSDSTSVASQARPLSPLPSEPHKTQTRDEPRPLAPRHAAETSQPSTKRLYDRAEPTDSANETTDRSPAAASSAPDHGKLTSKHVKRRAVASAPQYQSAPPMRNAPAPAVALPPPVVLIPPQAQRSAAEGDPHGRDDSDWRYSRQGLTEYSNRDDWRERRGYDDDGRRAGDGGPLGGFLGLLFGR